MGLALPAGEEEARMNQGTPFVTPSFGSTGNRREPAMPQLRTLLGRYPQIEQLANQLMAAIPLSSRLGKRFWEWYAFFQESETWSLEQVQQFQFSRLRDLLQELAATSKFYEARLAGANLGHISSLADFRAAVPTLTRSEFRNNYKGILNSSYKSKRLAKAQTSGTTGMAIQFCHTVNDDAREWAAICHQWKRVGYSPGISRRAEFRGLTSRGRLVELHPHRNMMRCSILNLKKQHVTYYADEVRNARMEFYHGYPSALYLLASEVIHSKIDFPQPKAVLLASEIVYDWQVARIQEAFPEAAVFAHYGCAERTVLAGWCEYRREYHVLPQYGLLEIDDATSEVIGTNLFNAVNGFVRYRMTDTVLKVDDAPCPDCRRPYVPRLIELGGRAEDYLFSPGNGWIPPAIVTYPLKSLKAIREVQFVQRERAEISVRYTTLSHAEGVLERELEQIGAGLRHLFGAEVKFKYEAVEEFERGATGKFKWIICELEEMPVR
jgi:phenylacetate-CoA ligase